ncbi:hypothetical protein BC832DRAFT_540254 [Gaertneriomyces semiglobifer]|nr:hypothetical protein BC832DRAFT_540254 [Gaertneriomyces semiglobifer]
MVDYDLLVFEGHENTGGGACRHFFHEQCIKLWWARNRNSTMMQRRWTTLLMGLAPTIDESWSRASTGSTTSSGSVTTGSLSTSATSTNSPVGFWRTGERPSDAPHASPQTVAELWVLLQEQQRQLQEQQQQFNVLNERVTRSERGVSKMVAGVCKMVALHAAESRREMAELRRQVATLAKQSTRSRQKSVENLPAPPAMILEKAAVR